MVVSPDKGKAMSEKSLYHRLVDAGFEIDHHESDLYVRVTDESRAIIEGWMAESGLGRDFLSTFVSDIDKKRYFDVPFAFQPYWDARAPKPEPEEEPAPAGMGM